MDYIHYLIDFILHIDIHLTAMVAEYGRWVYAILFIIIFCETGLVVTPFLPGDSMLFVAGALAAFPSNSLDVHIFAILMMLAAICGDILNFTIGRYFGKTLFANPDSRIFKRSYLEKTHEFYQRHGGKTIVLARFIPIVRTFAPFVAGMGDMTYRRFLAFNVLGGAVWVALFVYAGYLFGNLPLVHENLKLLVVAIILFSISPPIVEFLRQRSRSSSVSKR